MLLCAAGRARPARLPAPGRCPGPPTSPAARSRTRGTAPADSPASSRPSTTRSTSTSPATPRRPPRRRRPWSPTPGRGRTRRPTSRSARRPTRAGSTASTCGWRRASTSTRTRWRGRWRRRSTTRAAGARPGRSRFALVPAGETADLHAYLVTPGTTDRLCAPLLTRGEVSCRAGNKVVLNAKRWVLGAEAYGAGRRGLPGVPGQPRVRARARALARRLPAVRAPGAGDAAADEGPAGLHRQPLAVGHQGVSRRDGAGRGPAGADPRRHGAGPGRSGPSTRPASWHPEFPADGTLDAARMLLGDVRGAGGRPRRASPWWFFAVVVDGVVVGDAGFHGPPPAEGPVEVEIGYQVVPSVRRRGRRHPGVRAAARARLAARGRGRPGRGRAGQPGRGRVPRGAAGQRLRA